MYNIGRWWRCTCLWCFSFNCKLDLHAFQNPNGVAYRDKVLNAHIVPHFDNHPLAYMPIFVDDNTIPHTARIVKEFWQQEEIDMFQWPTMSPDMHPIENVWDFIGRKVNQHNPQCQNIAELTNEILEERLRRI